ncbi:hypothetical protein K402DRAFT_28519 [Aulographum hederae CBS 113979]|uniref:Uncharacterized protein n=1 Tax=Aulographum hederae CBS 113979 TaxID=1176131 RepID=A0A6G1H6Q7_9PEZI|nr:hypothetical protein K402DRAFT_28519 [Aulographum hederae CBS 113979]
MMMEWFGTFEHVGLFTVREHLLGDESFHVFVAVSPLLLGSHCSFHVRGVPGFNFGSKRCIVDGREDSLIYSDKADKFLCSRVFSASFPVPPCHVSGNWGKARKLSLSQPRRRIRRTCPYYFSWGVQPKDRRLQARDAVFAEVHADPEPGFIPVRYSRMVSPHRNWNNKIMGGFPLPCNIAVTSCGGPRCGKTPSFCPKFPPISPHAAPVLRLIQPPKSFAIRVHLSVWASGV